MSRIHVASPLLPLVLAVLLTGCSQGGQSPASPSSVTPDNLPHALADPGWITTEHGEIEAARFRLTIDLANQTATSELLPDRRLMAQPPQGLSFDFDIDQFRTPRTFQVFGLNSYSDVLSVGFSHEHPFPAPNLENPPTAGNRADLGYTGRAVLLTPGPVQGYDYDETTPQIVANPSLVIEADGYLWPGELLAATRGRIPLVNIYPYSLLADDGENNRYSISNDGNPQGNYAPAAGGWQRDNLGSNNRSWTGFDYIHAGQTIYNYIGFRKSAIGPTVFAIDVALLIKYTDPRGQGGPTYRLPPAEVNVMQFAYRLPYAALDCSKIRQQGVGTIVYTAGATSGIELRVRDWDAAASEAPGSTVGDQSDVSLVQQGGAGYPTGRILFPDLSDDPVTLTRTGGDGLPGSELVYTGTLTNEFGTHPGGMIFGMAEFTDPEFHDEAWASYHYGVDPFTIAPLYGQGVRPRTWQSVYYYVHEVPVAPRVTAVTPSGPTDIIGDAMSQVTFTATTEGTVNYWVWSFPNGGAETSYYGDSVIAYTPTLQLRLQGRGLYTAYVTPIGSGVNGPAFPFQFRVQENPYSLQPEAPLSIDATVNATGFDLLQSAGRCQVAVVDGATNTLYHYRATRNVPSDPSHWVRTQAAGTAGGNPRITLHNNRPVIIYSSSGDGRTRCAIATVEQPAGPADWNTYGIDANTRLHSELVVTGNRLMFAYRHNVTGNLMIARATAQMPGPTDWSYFEPQGSMVIASGQAPQMALEPSGGYARVLVANDVGRIYLFYTFNASPRLPEDWSSLLVQYENHLGHIPYPVGLHFSNHTVGPQFVAFNNMLQTSTLYTGNNYLPTMPDDWQVLPLARDYLPYQSGWAGYAGTRLVVSMYPPQLILSYWRPTLAIALKDKPVSGNDFFFFQMENAAGSAAAGCKTAIGIDAGVPKFMAVYAGTLGLRQAVLNREWYAMPES